MAFEALRQELAREVDAELAERLRLLPQKAGRVDPDRLPVEFTALLITGPREEATARVRRGARSGAVQVAAGGGELRLHRADWPELEIRQDDLLVALDRDGQPLFVVEQVDTRQRTRLVCELGEA